MQNFVEKILEALTQAGVEFVGGGGVSAAPGRPHGDAGSRSLLQAYVVDEHTLQMGANFTLDLEGEDLDLLAEMSGIGGYDAVVSGVLDLDVGGRQVSVLPLDRLIATKRAAGRAKDLAVLPLLEATLEATRRR